MIVEGQTFPKSVQPGIPKLGPTPKGWKRYRIGDLFDVVSRPTDLHDDQEYDLVTVKRSRGGIERRSHLLGREISVKSQFLLEEGDFLISKRQIVHGACAVVPAEFSGSIVSNEYSILRPRPVLSLSYLRYLVHSIYLQQTFFHSSVGVHVEKMIFRLEDWFKWPIHLPPVAEQEKLGRGLMDADAKIILLTDKTAALEDYKRGLMQRLFSRELRFARDDGSAFPDWEERKLGNVANIKKGEQINRDSLSDEGSFPVINGGTGPSGYHTEFNSLGDTITISEGGNSCGHVSWRNSPFWCGGHCYIVEPLGDSLSKSYLFQALKYVEVHIMRLRVGSGLPNIQKGDLLRVELPIPHPDEQRKIAAALSALDAKIDALSQKISEMEAFKKGLLQKLFV